MEEFLNMQLVHRKFGRVERFVLSNQFWLEHVQVPYLSGRAVLRLQSGAAIAVGVSS